MIPIATFVYYHARVLDELAKGTFSAETVRALSVEQESLVAAIKETNEEVIRRKLRPSSDEPHRG